MTLRPVDPFEWRRIVRRCRLGATTKHVASVLADYASPDGSDVRPGNDRLVAVTELGEKTVRRALDKLRTVGLILRVFEGSKQGRRALADEYRLTVPDDLSDRVEMLGPDERAPVKVTGDKPSNPVDNPVDNAETPVTETADPDLYDVEHRSLETGTPVTESRNTGHGDRPPNQAPTNTPTNNSNDRDHFGSVEGNDEAAEPKSDQGLSYSEAFKINSSLGAEIETFVLAVKADAIEYGLEPPSGQALAVAVAKLALLKYPQLLPERRTA
ncbi:hypothetical protein E1286_04990 [Nonomuraea terrae]|uniref:Helix-turn-helix domain-containing protein n=1 Tax=Nonomuraea terrae TaxID=2530383 RepID=A0A4R4ZBJ9_9ACTN|nr:helix-turn-helix domain-containing protein [Nonomuraea terrae]TDD54549.1 hypothetical protein E1286_04990 [Nonomuraea terrae]